MRFLLVLAALLALAFADTARAADVRVAALSAAEDISLPFWCDWGYDWDERCYRDDSDRLSVGGVDDKVWRSALRFSLATLPPRAQIVTAELALSYDWTCVALRRTFVPCNGAGFELEAAPILTPRWLAEREVEIGPVAARAAIEPLAPPGAVVWDLTDLVVEWAAGQLSNYGVLIKLAEEQEAFDSGGPAFPSSSYAAAPARPRLTVWYLP
jgi:hypothetical protein